MEYQDIISLVQDEIEQTSYNGHPSELYEPMNYMIQLGGKRLRPVTTLLSTQLFSGDIKKAIPAAKAIEVFHNFTLIHDDIMDKAPLRRGKETVHEKWNNNIAILSGDTLLIEVYNHFLEGKYENLSSILKVFNQTAIQVCEGQQLDMNFETRQDVTIEEYINMIRLKTSVLVGGAFQIGALVANAKESESDLIYEFGVNLGIAFQLQDDYLDAFGNPKTFGKQVGGDIIANKKTFLYITAMNNASPLQAKELESLSSITPKDPQEKIAAVKRIFVNTGADEALQREIEFYTEKANTVLSSVKMEETNKATLREFGQWLVRRTV